MSWSISSSSADTASPSPPSASGLIEISLTSRSPETLTVTMPPPAEASTTSSLSCSWAFIISACICCTCLSILFMLGCGINSFLVFPYARCLRVGGLHVLGVECALEALDQLVLGEHRHRADLVLLGQLESHRVGAPGDQLERASQPLPVRAILDLALAERRRCRIGQHQHVVVDRHRARVGQERGHHLPTLLLA